MVKIFLPEGVRDVVFVLVAGQARITLRFLPALVDHHPVYISTVSFSRNKYIKASYKRKELMCCLFC